MGVPIASLRGLGSDFRAVAPNNVGGTKLIIQAPQQLELPSVINVQVEYRLSRPEQQPQAGAINHSESLRNPLHKSPRRVHLRPRAVFVVANTRNSYGSCCVLRLAAHPDPQRTLAARFVQRILSRP